MEGGRPEDGREHGAFRGGVQGILHSPVGQEQWKPLKCFKQESDIQVCIYKIH